MKLLAAIAFTAIMTLIISEIALAADNPPKIPHQVCVTVATKPV